MLLGTRPFYVKFGFDDICTCIYQFPRVIKLMVIIFRMKGDRISSTTIKRHSRPNNCLYTDQLLTCCSGTRTPIRSWSAGSHLTIVIRSTAFFRHAFCCEQILSREPEIIFAEIDILVRIGSFFFFFLFAQKTHLFSNIYLNYTR